MCFGHSLSFELLWFLFLIFDAFFVLWACLLFVIDLSFWLGLIWHAVVFTSCF